MDTDPDMDPCRTGDVVPNNKARSVSNHMKSAGRLIDNITNHISIMFMLSLISIVITCVSFAACQRQSPATHYTGIDTARSVSVGKNIAIPSQFSSLPLVEPHVSVHPSNNDHLLVAAMVVTNIDKPYESCRLSSFVSADGGNSWKETAHDWWGYDPWTAILPDGQTVMSWIGTEKNFQDKYPVVFFSSGDGGLTWNTDVQILEGGHDGTKITAGNNGFYFTTVWFDENMGANVRLYSKVSTPSFILLNEINGNGERLDFAEPAILSDGSVIVPSLLRGQQAWVHVSRQNGKSFAGPFTVTERAGKGGGYSHLVADNSNTSTNDRLYFVRVHNPTDDDEGIWLNYSIDKGNTWSEDRRVDLFETVKSGCKRVPNAAVNRDGVLGISWVDCYEDEKKEKFDLYFTVSKDGGKTFQRPVRITEVSSDPDTKANSDVANKFPGGGHYLGLTAKPDNSFQLVWSDSRNGIFQLQTCNVTVKK